MNIIIKRFVISIFLLAVVALLITKVYEKNVYQITYDVYMYDVDTQTHILNKEKQEIYIEAFTKSDAVNDAVDFLYLNSLIVSDSIDIKSVQKF